MYKNMEEVREKFDEIKDHKPRATKKLNELGDILASAYTMEPETANEMWQYIVDLNVSDDITFSKFYIAQVFNKLTDRMKPEDATAFLTMNPERVQLMITYGYDGGTLWHCLNTLLDGYIASGSVENALVCLEYFYDKFGGINSGNTEIINVARNASKVCAERICSGINVETAKEVLDELGDSENDDINTYINIVKAIHGIGNSFDFEFLFDAAIEEKYPVEFFELLWAARNEYDETELKDKWGEYVECCEDNQVKPYGYIRDDSDDYDSSKLKFYVDLEKDADELLDSYFARSALYDVEKGVIWYWIENGDWDRFAKHIAQVVMNTSEASFTYSDIRRTLEEYMNACFMEDYCDSTDNYGRSYKELMKFRAKEFGNALAKVSAIAVGCEAHESFHEYVKAFVQKLNGNLDSLNELGFDDEVDTRTAEDRLKEYIHDFLESGELVHEGWGTKYKLIQDALREELYGHRGGNKMTVKIDITSMLAKTLGVEVDEPEENEEEEEIDEQLERDYRFASDDEIAEFYFKHYPQEYNERESLLAACIKKNDINRALELIDMMAETKENDGYDELNGWGRQNMLTIHYLIDEFDYNKKDEWRGEKITDEMRQVAKQLVYRMMPHLPEKSQQELKSDLYKIDPGSEDKDEYITNLLEDVDVYTTFPKPRGKGGAPNINRMSSEIRDSFEKLVNMGRIDVIVEIMTKFASVRDILKPVSFDNWMFTMSRALKDGEMVKIFRSNRFIFEAWLDGDNLRDWDIKRVAEEFADGCTREEFMEFRNMVISKKGKIDGLDSCFKATSENTETQSIFDGQTVKIDLDYVDVIGDNPVSNVEINLLSTAKTRKLDSVRLLKCEVNGIETNDCGFICEMDGEPTIGYNIFSVNNETSDELTIYSDFFEDNDIDEVQKIVLKFVVMDDDADVIEELSDVVITLDDETGEYRVSKEASSLNCTVEVDDEEDEEDNSDGINIDVTEILRNALQNALGKNAEQESDCETIEMENDDFTDTAIYESDNVLVEFCGIDFDEYSEELEIKLWCSNHSDEGKKFWLDELKINGVEHGSIKILGTVDSTDSTYCNYTISDFDYESIEKISFIVEIDDLNNQALAISKRVTVKMDTEEESFYTVIEKGDSYSDEPDDSEDDNDDEEAFEDITIYNEDDTRVDFCGIEFDDFLEEINLSIWCSNSNEDGRNFWIEDVYVNGESHKSIESILDLDANESNYCEFAISEVDDLDYTDIETISFRIEIDDEDNCYLADSMTVTIEVDTLNETFKASID